MLNIMENKVKRIGYLPRKRVLEIIDDISKSESISRSKVVGILVEEALDARGIANFGYSNISKSNLFKSDNYEDIKNDNLYTYNWPGNVRELRNLIERVTILSANEPQSNINQLMNDILNPASSNYSSKDLLEKSFSSSLKEARRSLEKE